MSAGQRRLLLAVLACLTLAVAVVGGIAVAGARRADPAHRSAAARAHHRASPKAKRHAKKRKHGHAKKKSVSPEPAPPSGSGEAVASSPPSSGEGTAAPAEGASKASSSDPFAALPMYVEPGSPAAQTAAEWSREGRAAEAAQIEKIATRPTAKWFGDWSYGHGGTQGDVSWWVGQASAAGRLPLLVAYDLPWRDCDQYSAGGASGEASYKKFVDEMAAGIAGRGVAVILEPDALAELECLSSEQQSSYYAMLSYAVRTLGKSAATAVYLDAGHAGWQPAGTIATRLQKSDVTGSRGFSLNVSNFGTTASEESYGEAIVAALGGGSHFVIDTSRNGRGPASGGEWCNPPGRGLGTAPTAATGNAETDALLWVKHPGTSDGTCNGGPSAGTWWPAAGLELAQHSAG